jgi:hypothetical protein
MSDDTEGRTTMQQLSGNGSFRFVPPAVVLMGLFVAPDVVQ